MLTGRAALELVAPIQEKLGIWQSEAVKLEVMGQRLRASGRRDPRLGEAVRTLLDTVEKQADFLQVEVADAPTAVREHSRVTDTVKVLQLLLVLLGKILSNLGEASTQAR